jgi:hypothetical protein
MDTFAQFLETFVSRDREMKKRNEQDFIELVKMIKSELILLCEQDQGAELEQVD